MQNQKNPLWKDRKINGTNSTLGDSGCFLVCLSEFAHITPLETLKKLEGTNALNRDLVVSNNAAERLGLQYDGISKASPIYRCIAEVDFNPATAKKEQHFVIHHTDGTLSDPWGGINRKRGHYKIINYRLFHELPIDTTANCDLKYPDNFRKIYEAVEELLGRDDGDNPNDEETKEILEGIKNKAITIFNWSAPTNGEQLERIEELEKIKLNHEIMIEDLQAKIDFLSGVSNTNSELREDLIKYRNATDEMVKELNELKQANEIQAEIIDRWEKEAKAKMAHQFELGGHILTIKKKQ